MRIMATLSVCLTLAIEMSGQQVVAEPTSADASGGATVVLHGSHFLRTCTTPDCALKAVFGDTPARIVSASDDTIVLEAPPHRPGRTTILVAWPGFLVAYYPDFYYEADSNSFQRGTVLLPLIWIGETQGAYGSRWRSDLVIHDRIAGRVSPDPKYLPKANDANPSRFLNLGEILHTSIDFAERATIQLRVHEGSQQAETWGVEIPVVRDTDLHIERVTLVAVPTDTRFRVALRIYMVNGMRDTGSVAMPFWVRIFPEGAQTPIVEDRVFVATPYPTQLQNTKEPLYPAIYQDFDLALRYPAIAGYESIRIEIEPDGLLPAPTAAGRRPLFWAFAGITHKASQHVTIISPQ